MAPARVLVVDDSPTILKVVSAILARAYPNEEAEVWVTSLRFSSISDLLSKN